MKRLIFLMIVLGVIPAQNSYALTSIETTLSGGYYRDFTEKTQTEVNYNLRYNYIHANGMESMFELGFNNTIVYDEWKFIPYQMFVTIPFDYGVKDSPTHISRVSVGRQILAEGFDFDILDGAVFSLYFNNIWGANFYAGSLEIIDDTEFNFDEQIYGGNLIFRSDYLTLKTGPVFKVGEYDTRELLLIQAMKTFDQTPLKPTLMGKKEWDPSNSQYDQELVEINLDLNTVSIIAAYTRTRPDPVILQNKSFIYQLFVKDQEKSSSGIITWSPYGNNNFEVSTKFERINYKTNLKDEVGFKSVSSLRYRFGRQSISPSFLYMDSWGGDLWDIGLAYKYILTDKNRLNINADILKMEKINGIYGWAYSLRGDIDYNLQQKWLALFRLEFERNHVFDFDMRVSSYVTYYYY